MKKLIAAVIIMLFTWLLLSSCGYNPPDFSIGSVVISTESISHVEGCDGKCIYRTREKAIWKPEPVGWFIDNCDKYKVGDTVQTIKYIKPH